MKQYLYTILCGVAMACTALLAGCTKDPIEENGKTGDGKTINATFTLAADFVEEIEVRSVSGADEKVIKDLWVVQLNADGTAQLQAPQYITTGFTSTSTDYKVSIPLKREASKIYFITNTGSPSAYTRTTTTAAVEAVTKEITAESDLASADGIPMAGVWTGTPDLLGIAGRVSLSRAVAKVNFNLNALLPHGENFTLESVTVKQVPKALNYYRDATTLDTYPYPTTPATFDYPATVYDKELTTLPESMGWYLPENARGKGDATSQADKGAKLPAHQAGYCTYIEVVGTYSCFSGWFTTTYRIYLGANNTNDYNLKRNTAYTVATTIRGIDAADTRIDIVEIKPLDFTGNESGGFLIAPENSKNPSDGSDKMNWYMANGISDPTSNPNVYKACPEGWRLPEKGEADLMWIYRPAIPDGEARQSGVYWLTTLSQTSPLTAAWYSNQSTGLSLGIGKTASYSVRCIRATTATTGKKYPYVGVNTEGKKSVIVSRDADGGVNAAGVLSVSEKAYLNTKPLVSYDEQSSYNKVSPKFEVAQNNANVGKYSWTGWMSGAGTGNDGSGCPAGWRMPNQRELILIMGMALKNELTGVTSMIGGDASSNKYYMNSTQSNQTPENVWTVSSTLAHVSQAVSKTAAEAFDYIRCIRDVD